MILLGRKSRYIVRRGKVRFPCGCKSRPAIVASVGSCRWLVESAPLQSRPAKIWGAFDQTTPRFAKLLQVQVTDGRADIDISGLEFDFVRSIRVWDVRHYSHRERGRDDVCSESYNMRLGTYGTQGDFHWQRTTPTAAPKWVLPSRRCSSANWRRGVGVEWEDH